MCYDSIARINAPSFAWATNLSARGRSGWRLRSLALFSVLFKCARYGFDMSIEIDHRIEHLAAPRTSGFLPRRRQGFETKYVPYNSLRVNEERDTSLGETHQTAADAVCFSGFARLVTQHRVLLFVVVRTRTLRECGGGVWHSAHTVTLFFVAKSLIAGTGSAEIPTTVMPESLNSTFSKCTRYPSTQSLVSLTSSWGVKADQ